MTPTPLIEYAIIQCLFTHVTMCASFVNKGHTFLRGGHCSLSSEVGPNARCDMMIVIPKAVFVIAGRLHNVHMMRLAQVPGYKHGDGSCGDVPVFVDLTGRHC